MMQTNLPFNLSFGQEMRVRILQVSGISLITLGVMNQLFLSGQTWWLCNMALILFGLGEGWLSLRLWGYYKRSTRPESVARYSPASTARMTSHRLTSANVPARF